MVNVDIDEKLYTEINELVGKDRPLRWSWQNGKT